MKQEVLNMDSIANALWFGGAAVWLMALCELYDILMRYGVF
jgi:hypothetical protein